MIDLYLDLRSVLLVALLVVQIHFNLGACGPGLWRSYCLSCECCTIVSQMRSIMKYMFVSSLNLHGEGESKFVSFRKANSLKTVFLLDASRGLICSSSMFCSCKCLPYVEKFLPGCAVIEKC